MNQIYFKKQETPIIRIEDKKKEEILNKLQSNKPITKEERALFFKEKLKNIPKGEEFKESVKGDLKETSFFNQLDETDLRELKGGKN